MRFYVYIGWPSGLQTTQNISSEKHFYTRKIYILVKFQPACEQPGLGASFSRVPKSFRTRQAVAKSRSLWLQSCSFHLFSINRGSILYKKFQACNPLWLYYRLTKNDFSGPKTFRRLDYQPPFQETGPRIQQINLPWAHDPLEKRHLLSRQLKTNTWPRWATDLSLRYGHVILTSGYLVLAGVNWP